MAGPIGWTLGGIGALAIPFAWTVSKSKQKTQLEAECDKQVKRVLDFILNERVPALRRNAEVIVLDFETRLDRDIEQVEAALATAGSAKLSEAELAARIELARDLESVLTERVAGA
jgi:hypothetical protein